MTLMENLRFAIKAERIKPIFKPSDLQEAGISDEHDNLSNYDKKNLGSKNRKVLVSREIGGSTYYTFDEQLFPDN